MSDANTPAADAVILQRFRKKPVVIDAYQLPPAGQDVPESFDDWCALVGFVEFESGRDEGLIIKTLEGDMTASPGDWIIMGVNGEFYPCKPDIFAKTYEPADASAPRESALIAERDALQLDLRRLMEKHNALHVNDQAVRVERDALRASLPQWISITDARKPAFRRPVLVRVEWSKIVLSDANEDTYEHGVDVTEGEYCPAPEHGSAYFESYQGTHHDSSGVTHWMELPSATLTAKERK